MMILFRTRPASGRTCSRICTRPSWTSGRSSGCSLVEIECRRKQQEDEDRRFKEEQLKLWAERDRLDQLSNEKRRLKLMEHRRAIQELLEERRQRRADEVKELMQMQSLFEQEEKRREEIIEEERIKLLKEHVTALLGFLPPGVLRESDREHLPLPKDK
ncbi:hypothetical protein quinque_015250 [Culex quinquefasciatus]